MATTDSPATTRKMGELSQEIRAKLSAKVAVPGLDFHVPAWAALIPYEPDRDVIAERIAFRAFEAETLEDMLGDNNTDEIEGLAGVPMRITGVTLQRSTIEQEGGIGVYCVIEYTNLRDGSGGVTTTSAKGVMMQLANAVTRGWLPFDCTVAIVDTGKNGRSNPLHLASIAKGKPGEEPF